MWVRQSPRGEGGDASLVASLDGAVAGAAKKSWLLSPVPPGLNPCLTHNPRLKPRAIIGCPFRTGSDDRHLRRNAVNGEGLRLVSRNGDARKLASLREKVWLSLNDLTQGSPAHENYGLGNPGLDDETPLGFLEGTET